MALWSFIISIPFSIMYFSLCSIDCGHWMLSLNQFFPEEKCFVYEQSLALLTMTAFLKWIRKKPETSVHRAGHLFSACPSYSIRDACLFPNRAAYMQATKHYIFDILLFFPFSRIKKKKKCNRKTWNLEGFFLSLEQ